MFLTTLISPVSISRFTLELVLRVPIVVLIVAFCDMSNDFRVDSLLVSR